LPQLRPGQLPALIAVLVAVLIAVLFSAPTSAGVVGSSLQDNGQSSCGRRCAQQGSFDLNPT